MNAYLQLLLSLPVGYFGNALQGPILTSAAKNQGPNGLCPRQVVSHWWGIGQTRVPVTPLKEIVSCITNTLPCAMLIAAALIVCYIHILQIMYAPSSCNKKLSLSVMYFSVKMLSTLNLMQQFTWLIPHFMMAVIAYQCWNYILSMLENRPVLGVTTYPLPFLECSSF